jgi:hypothetical protein
MKIVLTITLLIPEYVLRNIWCVLWLGLFFVLGRRDLSRRMWGKMIKLSESFKDAMHYLLIEQK